MMSRFLAFAAAPALAIAALSACTTPTGERFPQNPGAIADGTTLDEKAAIGAELAYQGFRTAAELAVNSGKVTGQRAAMLAELDKDAFGALEAARLAYDAGNAEDYRSALSMARAAITEGLAIVRGREIP